MKAEIELSLDSKGEPVINIVHHDKSNEIEQLLLKRFIEKAKTNGIKLVMISGYREIGLNNRSEDRYNIVVDNKKAQSWEQILRKGCKRFHDYHLMVAHTGL